MEVAKKESELADGRDKYMEELKNLTERIEKLVKDKHERESGAQPDPSIQAATIAALEKQNGLLRQIVEEREDEISFLEKKIEEMEATNHGTKIHHMPLA